MFLWPVSVFQMVSSSMIFCQSIRLWQKRSICCLCVNRNEYFIRFFFALSIFIIGELCKLKRICDHLGFRIFLLLAHYALKQWIDQNRHVNDRLFFQFFISFHSHSLQQREGKKYKKDRSLSICNFDYYYVE